MDIARLWRKSDKLATDHFRELPSVSMEIAR
jgi:hypothetical protein